MGCQRYFYKKRPVCPHSGGDGSWCSAVDVPCALVVVHAPDDGGHLTAADGVGAVEVHRPGIQLGALDDADLVEGHDVGRGGVVGGHVRKGGDSRHTGELHGLGGDLRDSIPIHQAVEVLHRARRQQVVGLGPVQEGLGLAVPANYNAPGQIVIAGAAKAVEKAAALAKEKGAKMAVRLKVSGPFHTKMLQPAADRLGPELEKMHISPMKIPVFTNVDAKEVASEKDIIPILTKQICCPVRFSDIIQNMHEKGADTFIELGPGKALCGFVKRTLKGVTILNVEDESSLAKTMSKLQE